MDADADRAIVARQLGREPRAFGRVAVRCPFGRPAVTEQHPYAPDGEPFPTTYYVTCRYLVAAISRVVITAAGERTEVPNHLRLDVIASAKECPGDCIHVVRAADDVEVAGPEAAPDSLAG